MKKLIALCAVFGFAATANAQADMSNSGSFRLQYFNTDNANGFDEDTAGRTHAWQQRFQWNLGVKAGEDVSFNAKLVHAATWGANSDQYPGEGTNRTTTNGEDQDNVLIVNEANATWMMSDEMMARFGRGSVTMGDGTVISANEWEQIQKAFDGGIFMYDHEMAKISAFGVRGADLSGGNNTAAYGNFTGLAFDFKALPEFLKMAHLHYVAVKVDDSANIGNGEEDTTRLGIALGGDTSGIDYRVSYAMYSGDYAAAAGSTPADVEATMMDAELGYSMPETMNLRVHVLYHTDSGTGGTDNETYRPFHYDVHNNAGVMDLVQWGNLTYQKVGVSLDPMESVTFGIDYYMFTATEDADTTLNGPLTASVTTSDEIGEELDLWATKRYTDNFSITGWYAMFTPGDRLGADLDDRTQLYFAANYSF